jgi:uncharacterized RDD family membrane protein YckC
MSEQNLPVLPVREASSAPMERASFFQRFFAFFIDSIILGIINGCISIINIQEFPLGLGEQVQGMWSAAWGIILFAIPAVYFIHAYSTNGQTIGKRAMKIKVVSINGEPLTLRNGILRSLGYLLSAIPFYLGYLWSLGDVNRQAWHDKMAGTYVVPAAIAREQFLGTVDPAEIRRRQKHWLIRLGIPAIALFLVVIAIVFFFVDKGLTEVREMGQWPGKEASPADVIGVDLSSLGLKQNQVTDGRDPGNWSEEGDFEEGIMVTYGADANEFVAIWALRYDQKRTARNDYRSTQGIVSEPGNCGKSSYAYNANSGIIHCQFSDAYQKILWKDYWIINILALEGTQYTPDILVDQVRDAISAHWSTLGSD